MDDQSRYVILLIAGRESNEDDFAASIRNNGYRVETANTSEEAVNAVLDVTRVDLVIMDIDSGADIYKTITAGSFIANSNLPIVFLASSYNTSALEKIRDVPAYGYLLKSADPELVNAILKMALRLHHDYSQLRYKEQLLNMTEGISNVGSWEYDLINNRLTWSEEVFRILGLAPYEFDPCYDSFLEMIHPEDREIVDNAYMSSIEEGRENYEIEHRIIRKHTGEIRHVFEKCQHVRDQQGTIVRSIGMVQDITEQKLMNEALYYSEHKYRNLVDQAADMLFLHDLDGNIVDVNAAASKITGYSREELLKMKVSDIDPDFETREDSGNFWDNLGPDNMITFQGRHKSKTGTTYPVEVTLNRIQLQDGAYVLALAKDITERKKAETDLLQAIQEKDQLFAELQHRVKNSMQMMTSLVNLEYSRVRSGETKEVLDRLHGQVQSLGNLYKLLYDTGSISTANLEAYLSSIVSSLANTFSMSLSRVTVHQNYKPILFNAKNAASLGLIVNELVTNAMKYAFPNDREGNLWIELQSTDHNIILNIIDDGIGLPKDFDVASSSGSGMQLVGLLAKQLKGTFSYEKDNNTVFKVMIPLT